MTVLFRAMSWAALSVMLCTPPSWAACSLSDSDRAGVRAAAEEYVNAWLANDKNRVLALLRDDVVMIPHHGDPVKEGKKGGRGLVVSGRRHQRANPDL